MSKNKTRCSDFNNLNIDTCNDFDTDDINWDNLDFKEFDLTLDEIDVIIKNFSNFLNTKQLKYLNRQKVLLENSDSISEPENLTTSQRYYLTHKQENREKTLNWQKNNKDKYNKKMREYMRKRREENRLLTGKEKTNTGRPRIKD
jgi:hypothetical protein